MKQKTGKTRKTRKTRKARISTVVCAVILLMATVLSGCNADPQQIAQLVGAMAENPQKTQEIVQEPAAAENDNATGKSEGEATAENDSATGKSEGEAAAENDSATGKEDGKTAAAEKSEDNANDDAPALPEKDIYIICTSDVHCGIDRGFGYVGLVQVVENLRAQGCDVILVDNGDHVQGEPIGTVTKGEAIIPIMNAVGYDIAIPGNHEFDYGIDEFLKYDELAEFPYISCNITKDGKPVFEPYLIKEAGGKKIAFVGVTTPKTFTSNAPKTFQDENGKYIYGFKQGDGSQLYSAVQDAVDAATAEDADYVYLMTHIGNEKAQSPYNCMDLIKNTSGIDVVLDGHSHDNEKMVIKNKEGMDVTRIACGYKFNTIGYSHIKAKDGTTDTGVWVWENQESVPELLNISNGITEVLEDAQKRIAEETKRVVAESDVSLMIDDPVQKDELGYPLRIVRHRETNLGDLCADAVRIRSGADIGIVNGGGVREDIDKGDITYGDIMNVHPYGNKNVVIEVTGQQIEDALEWSCRSTPNDEGGFLQVSGMTFKVDTSVKSGCIRDENNMMKGISGERRVYDIMIGDKPLDPKAKYTIAGNEFILLKNGSGYTAFDNATIVDEDAGLDNEVLIDYIVEDLGGTIGSEYSDPYGQGRILIED
ncbi:MAG: bifunctional metallophosphatase/5'-nucleotidase [Lachnospiraceae bacterium]|nr:bifunctional metallophosphatase/5'-nucleotidase [Lachnospiraceae bacterium]